jgi:CubicO group peptidase (beta-lactamase class C family)
MIKQLRVTLPLLLLLSINCLAQNGPETRLAKGYGYANVEQQSPVKPETIFQSGSMGKQFTATAVMLLMEDGKLAVDDKLTIVLFANQARANQWKLAQGVAALLNPDLAP